MAKQYYEDQQQFDLTMDLIKMMLEEVRKRFKAVGDYIAMKDQYSPAKALAKAVKENDITLYKIHGKCSEELARELQRRSVPFITAPYDPTVLMIRKSDFDLVKKVNENVLIAKGNYYQEIGTSKLEDAIAKTDRIRDKEIITFHGLDKYQYETFKNKCNDITKGFMVGYENEGDGKIALSVHAQKVIVRDPEKMDVCKAFAESMLSLYGENAAVKMQQIEADEKLDKEVIALKGCESSHFIIGVDDPTKYIELNSQGFEFHRVKMVDGKSINIQENFVSKDSPDYEIELQKYMDGLYNKAIIDDEGKLFEHTSNWGRNFDTQRPEKNELQKAVSDMEKNVIERANFLVKTGPMSEQLFALSPKEAFTVYQSEMIEVIDAALTGKEMLGYDKNELKAIKAEFDKVGVNPEDYRMTIKGLRRYDIDSHKALEISKKPLSKEIANEVAQQKSETTKDTGERT